jgi:hypothetical protein
LSLHNFFRESAIYDDDFKNYLDEFSKDLHDEASIGIDEYDMGAFCDFIAATLLV